MNTMIESASPGTTGSKGNLLLVDDDADILKLLSIRLKASGYQVMTDSTNVSDILVIISVSRQGLGSRR